LRRGYTRLRPDIPGCVEVGGFGVPARDTGEGCLIESVHLVDHATARAANARIARIDQHQRHAAGQLCFVGNEAAKLTERPRMQAGSLIARGRYPTTNAVRRLVPKARHRQPSCSFVAASQRRRQACSLGTPRRHLYCGNQQHILKHGERRSRFSRRRAVARPAIPPAINGGVSRRDPDHSSGEVYPPAVHVSPWCLVA
jgi:hypothetical protein